MFGFGFKVNRYLLQGKLESSVLIKVGKLTDFFAIPRTLDKRFHRHLFRRKNRLVVSMLEFGVHFKKDCRISVCSAVVSG